MLQIKSMTNIEYYQLELEGLETNFQLHAYFS